ncbi:MAG: hypothetical protein RR288_02415, partial [Oscillibacter sp.]
SPGDASTACRRTAAFAAALPRSPLRPPPRCRVRRYVRRPQKFSILHKLYLSLVTDFTQGCLY